MKRILDLCVSAIGLVVFAPIMIIVATLVFLTMGPPVLFCQTRIGRDEEPFRMVKFRTMRQAKEGDLNESNDEIRLTRVGRFLRSTSLDEIPELWNVLVGDMSLVGPRPLLPEYLPLYSDYQRQRHELRPGITGWAQINGRNGVNWDERLEMDVWYVTNRSMMLDLKILWRTIEIVLLRKGISHGHNATMPKFRGSDR